MPAPDPRSPGHTAPLGDAARASASLDPESQRLVSDARRDYEGNWKRWGPYLSERQWGTVREDYSPDGDCWNYLPHDHARSRAYRWGEDGLLGICDRQCRLCFALALWNGNDKILKERLFGLTGPEGNHGEDVKEHYFYLDSTPTHSYMKALYKYPQAEFPYDRLVAENRTRGRELPEFELSDTGAFDQNRYFDVQAEYAKESANDILIRITITNRGPDPAPIHVLPTLWCRNNWVWGCTHEGCEDRSQMQAAKDDPRHIIVDQPSLGRFHFHIEPDATPGAPRAELLFTDNETNMQRLFGTPNPFRYVKDGFHDRVIHNRTDAVNPDLTGTKAAAWYQFTLAPGQSRTIRMRLFAEADRPPQIFGPSFDQLFAQRIGEADLFFASRGLDRMSPENAVVARQAFAGLLWSKQFYHYVVDAWLKGDPNQPKPSKARKRDGARNVEWRHLFNRDVISMPDKWEYPWYAAWDLAFHMIPFARIDGEFAKQQLLLFLREWYMHPSGQIPAYEFALGDVNPPVHAWACWRVYKMTGCRGERDRDFLARAFHKLMLNFTWWVNRKDPTGKNLFSGGFLGLDNIGVFDRSRPLPTGGHLEQADGTAWMAFYCGTMLSIALELASFDPVYEDVASKFFEHFVAISDSMNTLGGSGLWDEQDGFYYDQIWLDGKNGEKGAATKLRVRSLVGVIPLLAVEILEDQTIDKLPGFRKRMDWFLKYRPDLARHISYMQHGMCADHEDAANGGVQHPPGGRPAAAHGHRLLAIPSRERLQSVLRYLFDESEFLSPFGIRSLSKFHHDHPFIFKAGGEEFRVDYTPGESNTGIFGGNSNWRGPIWFPLNFLIVEALERYDHFYGADFQIEFPTGSGKPVRLAEAANLLRRRLAALFTPDASGQRPSLAGDPLFQSDASTRDLVLFHEHFHGDTGRGLGASHQTGWTALIATLLREPTSSTSGPSSRKEAARAKVQ